MKRSYDPGRINHHHDDESKHVNVVFRALQMFLSRGDQRFQRQMPEAQAASRLCHSEQTYPEAVGIQLRPELKLSNLIFILVYTQQPLTGI